MKYKTALSFKSKSLLRAIELRLNNTESFFLLASGRGEVRIVDTLTDFGNTVYLAVGRGEKSDLLLKARIFLEENTLLAERALKSSNKLDQVLAKSLLKT